MDAYGGVGLKAVQEWDDTPLATVSWLLGCRMRRMRPAGTGPEPIGSMTAEDRAVIKLLEDSHATESLRQKFLDRKKIL